MNTDTGEVLRVACSACSTAASLAVSAALASSLARSAASVLACACIWRPAPGACVSATLADGLLLRQLRLLQGFRRSALCRPRLLELTSGGFQELLRPGMIAFCRPQQLGGRRPPPRPFLWPPAWLLLPSLPAASASAVLASAIDFKSCRCLADPGAASASDAGRPTRAAGRWSLPDGRLTDGDRDASLRAGFGLEKGRMRNVGGGDVVAHHDHAHADIRQAEQALGEGDRHAHAAVRCRVARQHARMKGDPGPRDALHEGHVAVFIDIGLVDRLLLHDAVDAGGRLVAGRAGRDRRLQDLALGIVDGDPLVAERDDRQNWRTRAPGLGKLIAVCVAAVPGAHRTRCSPSPSAGREQPSRTTATDGPSARIAFMSETSKLQTHNRRALCPTEAQARGSRRLITEGYRALATRKPVFSTRMPPAVA